MIELSDIEIGAVDGGVGFFDFVKIVDLLIDFGRGFIDGVNAASGG